MPTATMTATSHPTSVIPLKGGQLSPVSATTTAATLRSLYNRAARAFLHRDIEQTHSLLASAFSIIQPPSTFISDSLASHRRKWDLLRITLETTMYGSPADDESVPLALRDNRILSPQTLIQTLYNRSLALFTPTLFSLKKPTSAFLPSQVLITLVLSSMKLDCPDSGRCMVEDWLAHRGQYDESGVDTDGYEKVLDIYCLHVLPRLEEWDYAKEFLEYEGELLPDKRNHLVSSLHTLYTETMEARRPPSPSRTPTPSHPNPPSPRAVSPAPSASSSSSSVSTTSTHTAVPRAYHSLAPLSNGVAGLTTSLSSASLASDVTITKRPSNPRPTSVGPRGNGTARSASVSSGVSTSSIPRPPRSHPLEPPIATARPPTTLTLIKASLSPYLNTSKMTTFLLLFVLLPLMSVVLRVRRRQRILGAGGAGGVSAADIVRRRLAAAGQGQTTIGRMWGEVVRAVIDTVRMGGGGLV